MKPLSKQATRTFNRLVEGLDLQYYGAHKIDNAPGVFMAVCANVVDHTPLGPVVAITHYYEQNGDLVTDPEMTFLVIDHNDERGRMVLPMTFEQGGRLYQVAIDVQDDGNMAYRRRLQEIGRAHV